MLGDVAVHDAPPVMSDHEKTVQHAKTDPGRLSAGLHALSRALFITTALVVGVIGPLITRERDKARV